MSNILEWCRYVLDDVISVPYLALGVTMFFVVMTFIVMLINGTISTMAKVRRANKKADKFYKTNSSIDYNSIISFRHKSISRLPLKCRKEWRAFENSGAPIEKSTFMPTLRDSTGKGGSVAFAIYLYQYIFLTIVLVLAMCVSSIDSEIASLYVCGGLIAGALGLFFIGLQLYFMDKKADKILDNFSTNLVSRMLVFKAKDYAVSAAIAEANDRKKRAIAEQIKSHIIDVDNAEIYNLCRIDDDRNKPQPVKEPAKAEPIIVNSAFKASDFNKLEGLIANENRLKEGYASMESLSGGGIIYDDCVSRLDRLISKIISDKNCTPDLIETIYDCINAAVESKYAKPIDELRMRCVIRKLKRA